MSVTVEDLLRLPSLRGAELVAGQGAGKKLVSSISVLEYADPSVLQAELFRNNEFFGSEIVITGFMNIPRDVEAQCANLRRLADAGEVGLILFYVGVFMPEVDPRLMALADEKDFALIVMPRGRMDLRYSDVICEVMEAIFKDQNDSGLLVSDILGRTALLPEHQRTLDTVLKLLSDRLRATVLLTDGALRPLNAVPWPRAEDTRLPEALRSLEAPPVSGGAPGSLQSEGRSYTVYRQTLSSGPALELFLLKEGAPLPPDLVRRAGEVVHLASSIWSQGHGRVVMSELVRAIFRDEPVKMRRLAELFHVDVASMHAMWVLRCGRSDPQTFQAEGLELVRKLLEGRCSAVVADCYEGDVVAFLAWKGRLDEMRDLAEDCCARLEAAGLDGRLIVGQNLATTADVRRGYLTIRASEADALRIWPGRRWFSLEEIAFTAGCREILQQGEAEVQRRTALLQWLRTGTETDLVGTLAVYFLDAAGSLTDAAARLFVHKNTVKYRIQQAEQRLGYPVDKLPEAVALYTACALERLLSGAELGQSDNLSGLFPTVSP